ncbi:MAG TPA: tRNA-intron lyase [Methanocorpusculum sp.]|nr:tRNA-intron lyase [Methanocorpusculum sp.]
MKAQFDGMHVLAPLEAKVFYEQNGYGRVEKTGNLRLAVVEALYLIARGKIQIDGWSFDSLLAKSAVSPGFLRKFTVYRDIRERGFVVTTGPQYFRVFPRGQRPKHGQSKYLLRVLSERDMVDFSVVLREAQTAAGMRKQFLLAVVDDEQELTYYEIRITRPAAKKEGDTIHASKSLPNISATLAGTSAYVTEDGTGVTKTLKDSWYGTMLDATRLFLAPVEVCWLLESGNLSLTPVMTAEEYKVHAAEYDPEFADKMTVYRYFRGIGWAPRTGYKYGHHFRVYTEEGKHSEVLVHACGLEHSMSMSVISRSVRLSHSVKKKMFFACMDEACVTFIEFARMKL